VRNIVAVPLFKCNMQNSEAMKPMKNNTGPHRALFRELLYRTAWEWRGRHNWIARGPIKAPVHRPDYMPLEEVGLSYCADKYGVHGLTAWKVTSLHSAYSESVRRCMAPR